MKRVVSLGLAAVMTASLAACGSSSSDTTTAAADAAENTAAAEGGDSASAEGGSFKIGVIGPQPVTMLHTVWLYSMAQSWLQRRSTKQEESTALLLNFRHRMMRQIRRRASTHTIP